MTGKLTFLGTGTSQGIPIPACSCAVCTSPHPKDNRLRSSVLIEVNEKTLCIDTGPDFRQQMLRERVKNLDAILYTHEHRDHISGLDDIRAYNYAAMRPIPLYAPSEVVEALHRSYHYIFNSNYPGIPKVILHEIDEAPLTLFGLPITPIPVYHYELRVFGYRLGNIAYITDAKTVPESSRELIRGVDTLIINCLHESPHISHFNLEEALQFIEDIGPSQSYLTHISHLFGSHDEINAKLPAHVFAAYDGLRLDFHIETTV